MWATTPPPKKKYPRDAGVRSKKIGPGSPKSNGLCSSFSEPTPKSKQFLSTPKLLEPMNICAEVPVRSAESDVRARAVPEMLLCALQHTRRYKRLKARRRRSSPHFFYLRQTRHGIKARCPPIIPISACATQPSKTLRLQKSSLVETKLVIISSSPCAFFYCGCRAGTIFVSDFHRTRRADFSNSLSHRFKAVPRLSPNRNPLPFPSRWITTRRHRRLRAPARRLDQSGSRLGRIPATLISG